MENKTKHLEQELRRIEKELVELRSTQGKPVENDVKEGDHLSADALMRYLMDQRDKSDRLLDTVNKLTAQVKNISTQMDGELSEEEELEQTTVSGLEVAISALDKKILDFVQSSPHSMACADDVRALLGYKGRNAACTRLMKLAKMRLLERIQLGHKVYYKFDAGKATNTLIISPQQ